MTSRFARWRDDLLPSSIVARMSLVLFTGILIAQILGTLLWTRQLEIAERDRLVEISHNMGARMGQTILFFSRLPHQYRHIVLDQLRDMGGTRFFVSVNPRYLALDTLSDHLHRSLHPETLPGPGDGRVQEFTRQNFDGRIGRQQQQNRIEFRSL